MAIKLCIQGTKREIENLHLWNNDELCVLIRVDPYKQYMIPENEVFTITQEDVERLHERKQRGYL